MALDRAHAERLFTISRTPFGPEPPGRLLEAARANLARHFFFVGISEWLDRTLAHLSAVFGVELTARARVYATPFKSAFADLSAATRRQLAEKTAADDTLYRFARDMFDRSGDPQAPAR